MTDCCVPFCRRWTKRKFGEFLCQTHWKLVDKPLRREKLEADKRYRACEIDREAYDAVWGRCKAQAIERAL
jgi:hypothetical protein